MYGFTEEKNPYDDVYLPDDIIKAAVEKHEVEAKDAKIKLLDSLGFFSEGELKSQSERGKLMYGKYVPLICTGQNQMSRGKSFVWISA